MIKPKNNIPKYIYSDDNFIVEGDDGKEMLLRIVSDDDPESPREWGGNIGKRGSNAPDLLDQITD